MLQQKFTANSYFPLEMWKFPRGCFPIYGISMKTDTNSTKVSVAVVSMQYAKNKCVLKLFQQIFISIMIIDVHTYLYWLSSCADYRCSINNLIDSWYIGQTDYQYTSTFELQVHLSSTKLIEMGWITYHILVYLTNFV